MESSHIRTYVLCPYTAYLYVLMCVCVCVCVCVYVLLVSACAYRSAVMLCLSQFVQ